MAAKYNKSIDDEVIKTDCTAIHHDVIEKVRKTMPPEEQLLDLGDFFKNFGDGTRIRILWALSQNEMCVCDIAVLLNMTKSAISHQLRVLKQNRLIKYRRDGQVIFYSLDDDHISELLKVGQEHILEEQG